MTTETRLSVGRSKVRLVDFAHTRNDEHRAADAIPENRSDVSDVRKNRSTEPVQRNQTQDENASQKSSAFVSNPASCFVSKLGIS